MSLPHTYNTIISTHGTGGTGGVSGTDVPAGTASGRTYTGGFSNYVVDLQDVESSNDTEVTSFCNGQCKIEKTASGYLVAFRATSANTTRLWYNTSGTPAALTLNVWQTVYTGTTTPTAFSFNGISWTTVTNTGDSITANFSAQAVADFPGITETDTSYGNHDIWIRATGYNDTKVVSFQSKAYAQATRQ